MELEIFERDDREEVMLTANGLSDLLTWHQAIMIVEKYGLSIVFDNEKIEWEASDPKGAYHGRSNTPAGAIFMWDINREDAEEKQPNLVEEEAKPQ